MTVNRHPEGPATVQLNKSFTWFSSFLEQMLSWNPKSTLFCVLLTQSCQH